MPRGASNDVITELSSSQMKLFHLFEGVFPDGTVRFTDNTFDLTVNGEVYYALGYLLSFDEVEESTNTEATGVNITLAGTPSSIIALVNSQDLVDRQVYIYRGFLDTNNAVILDPILLFKGKSDEVSLSEDYEKGEASVTIKASNEWIDFDRVNGRRTNHSEQQKLFPGDKGFSFVADLADKVIQWN